MPQRHTIALGSAEPRMWEQIAAARSSVAVVKSRHEATTCPVHDFW